MLLVVVAVVYHGFYLCRPKVHLIETCQEWVFVHLFNPPVASGARGAGAGGRLGLGGLESHRGWWAVRGLGEQHVFLHRRVFHHPGPPGIRENGTEAIVRKKS